MNQYNDIIEHIKVLCDDNVKRFAYLDFDKDDIIGKITEVQRYGGEGKGEEWYKVFYLEKPNIFC